MEFKFWQDFFKELNRLWNFYGGTQAHEELNLHKVPGKIGGINPCGPKRYPMG